MDKKILILFFLICFLFLAPYLNSVVDKGDGGEFILSTRYLGNSHPSGYPLYNIIGRLFHFLPISSELSISIMSLFFLCGSCILVFFILEDILENIFFSVTGAFCLLSGSTFVSTGTTQEIYSLFIFFFFLSVYFYIRTINTGEENFYFLMLFSLGLMTTVHITGGIYFIIFFLSVFFTGRRYSLKGIFYYIIPLMLYFYLFIRNNAFFSWGHIESISDIWVFVTGKERGVGARFFAMSITEYLYQLSVFVRHFTHEFRFLWFFSFPGIFFLYKYEKKYITPLFTSFVFCFIFFTSVARDINNKQHFFLICFAVELILIICGIYFMHNLLIKNKKPLYLLIFPLFLILVNKPDNSQLFVLERYADNIERSLKHVQNAKLFVESDEVTFRLWVRKYIYKRFENIEIINKDMLNASWYGENKKDITYYIENNFDVFCDTDPEFFRYYSLPYGMVYRVQKNFSKTDLSLWEDILLSEGDERITLREIDIIKDRYPVIFNDMAFQLVLEGKYDTAEDFLNLAIEREVNPQYVINLNIIKKREEIFKDDIERLIYFRRFEEAEKLLIAEKDIQRYAEFLYRLQDFNKLGDFKKLPDFYKGVLLFNKNKYSEALEFFNESSHIDRAYYVALIFYKIGMKQKSIEILENHLKVFSEDKKVNELLLRLKGYISVVGKGR